METLSYYLYNDYESEDVELYAEQMIRERIARDDKRRERIEKALAKAERARKRVENRRRKYIKENPIRAKYKYPCLDNYSS
jgi:hypothetical protein|nr:MAG TPA: hypothetical protein [Caudoviricetes sp.]